MTVLGGKRTAPRIGLKRRTPLKRAAGLKRHTALAQQSKQAKREAVVWSRVKKERMARLQERFGLVPCEYCLGATDSHIEFLAPEGHHNNKNRRDNTAGNCRILHRFCNQRIEDLNIRGIPSLLDDMGLASKRVPTVTTEDVRWKA